MKGENRQILYDSNSEELDSTTDPQRIFNRQNRGCVPEKTTRKYTIRSQWRHNSISLMTTK